MYSYWESRTGRFSSHLLSFVFTVVDWEITQYIKWRLEEPRQSDESTVTKHLRSQFILAHLSISFTNKPLNNWKTYCLPSCLFLLECTWQNTHQGFRLLWKHYAITSRYLSNRFGSCTTYQCSVRCNCASKKSIVIPTVLFPLLPTSSHPLIGSEKSVHEREIRHNERAGACHTGRKKETMDGGTEKKRRCYGRKQ